MLKNLPLQAGFSLIQSMFLASLVAGMALVGTKMVNDMKTTAKNTQSRDDLETFHEMIISSLLDVSNCKASLNSLTLPSGSKRIYLADGTVLVEEGQTYVNNSIKLNGMSLQTETGTNCPFFDISHFGGHQYMCDTYGGGGTVGAMHPVSDPYSPCALGIQPPDTACLLIRNPIVGVGCSEYVMCHGSSTPGKLPADNEPGLTLLYSKTHKGTIGAKQIKKFIPMTFIKEGANIDRCFADQTLMTTSMVKDFCIGLGSNFMTWDSVTNTCVMNNHTCGAVTDTIFLGIDSTGKEICKKFHEAVTPGDVFTLESLNYCTNRQTLSLAIDPTTGKIRLNCNGGASTSCSNTCDCPGTYDVCEYGVCVDRTAGCVNGTYAKGDVSCQLFCTGGSWDCPADGVPCGAAAKCEVAGTDPTITCENCSTKIKTNYHLKTIYGETVGACSSVAAGYGCSDYPTTNNCPNLTGCPTDCVPVTSCASIVPNYCPSEAYQLDSCGNSCGPGTKSTGCPDFTYYQVKSLDGSDTATTFTEVYFGESQLHWILGAEGTKRFCAQTGTPATSQDPQALCGIGTCDNTGSTGCTKYELSATANSEITYKHCFNDNKFNLRIPVGGIMNVCAKDGTVFELSGAVTVTDNGPCGGGAMADCTTPWGVDIPHGTTVVAYQNPTTTCGAPTCNLIGEHRVCNNGTLSGSYTHQNCLDSSCPPPHCSDVCCKNSASWNCDPAHPLYPGLFCTFTDMSMSGRFYSSSYPCGHPSCSPCL
jgi:hypothetical protein